jgi:hypothetical protein
VWSWIIKIWGRGARYAGGIGGINARLRPTTRTAGIPLLSRLHYHHNRISINTFIATTDTHLEASSSIYQMIAKDLSKCRIWKVHIISSAPRWKFNHQDRQNISKDQIDNSSAHAQNQHGQCNPPSCNCD